MPASSQVIAPASLRTLAARAASEHTVFACYQGRGAHPGLLDDIDTSMALQGDAAPRDK